MLRVTDIINLTQVYEYQMRLPTPFVFYPDFESWKRSFENDIDGEGRALFRDLYGKAVYDCDTFVGFIQYGYTAFGFDTRGELSADMTYPVIRTLYYDENQKEAGRLLLQQAMKEFESEGMVYAFFHYFGMSCFARHGKLFEHFHWIKELLHEYGFAIEHENVYFSAVLGNETYSEVEITPQRKTTGSQQTFAFIFDHDEIGGCEVHYLDTKGAAYLRWIYVNDEMQNKGIGSQCMTALKTWLYAKGMTRLDTDTALDNSRAQHYYEKNGFTREGITRSYYLSR